jgi:hypothetical protein
VETIVGRESGAARAELDVAAQVEIESKDIAKLEAVYLILVSSD